MFNFSLQLQHQTMQCKRRWEGWCPCVPCAVLIMPIHQVLMRSNINAGSRSAYLRTGQCRLSQELWWPFNLFSTNISDLEYKLKLKHNRITMKELCQEAHCSCSLVPHFSQSSHCKDHHNVTTIAASAASTCLQMKREIVQLQTCIYCVTWIFWLSYGELTI